MKIRDVLVVGAGISGCAIALALAKRGIAVSIMTSSFDQRMYHASFILTNDLDEKVQTLQQGWKEQLICARAHEQLHLSARKSVDELLASDGVVDCKSASDIHHCLQEQLKEQANVEWISHHSLIELITLDHHSLKKADRYKKPACLGVLAYNHEADKMERFLAKETVLATGGAASLFPYSTHCPTAYGGGLAIAYRAGVRLLNMDLIHFHPLGIFEKEYPCFPLPLELLSAGGQLHGIKADSLEGVFCLRDLMQQMYDHLFKMRSGHLWLDLTSLDPVVFKDEFPAVDAYCLYRGFNIAKDLLPVAPVACYVCGGIAVDRTGGTNVQRLRAIGEVACTGLFYDFKEEALSVLESLTWAVATAEDIAKQLNKLIYYFPDLKAMSTSEKGSSSIVEEDWWFLRSIMWAYAGIKRDPEHLERGIALLDQLLRANDMVDLTSGSIEQIQLFHAIQTARLIVHSAYAQVKDMNLSFRDVDVQQPVVLQQKVVVVPARGH